MRTPLVQGQELEHGQCDGEGKKGEPAVGHFATAPKPDSSIWCLDGKLAVSSKHKNPARMQADGKVKIARALIRETEQHAGEREAEKSGQNRMDIRETAQHAGKQDQPGIPANGSGGFRALEKMRERVNHAADEERERPVKHAAQTAKNAAAKQDFLQRADQRSRRRRAANGRHDFTGVHRRGKGAVTAANGNSGDHGQRQKSEQQSAEKFFPLAVRRDEADVAR